MKVNGKSTPLEEGITLNDFLLKQNLNTHTIAVERNGEIVPKSSYDNVNLSEEDILEIVHFVGGG